MARWFVLCELQTILIADCRLEIVAFLRPAEAPGTLVAESTYVARAAGEWENEPAWSRSASSRAVCFLEFTEPLNREGADKAVAGTTVWRGSLGRVCFEKLPEHFK
jgi:hypothetical protein